MNKEKRRKEAEFYKRFEEGKGKDKIYKSKEK